jgi:hypothetical protein
MSDAPTRPPGISRSVPALARTLVDTPRGWASSPPEHPVAFGSPDHWQAAIAGVHSRQILSFGVTPDTLIAGVPVEEPLAPTIGAAAKWRPEPDGRGEITWTVAEAVDPESAEIDPLKHM